MLFRSVIFIFLTPRYAPILSAFLFGNILTITRTDIWGIAALALGLILLFSFYMREIIYVAFDRDFDRKQGLPVRFIEYLMMVSSSVTRVVSIRLMGIMLLMSLLTIPQVTINLFTASFKKIVWGSVLLGFAGCVTGLFLSYFLNVPSGAFIILEIGRAHV